MRKIEMFLHVSRHAPFKTVGFEVSENKKFVVNSHGDYDGFRPLDRYVPRELNYFISNTSHDEVMEEPDFCFSSIACLEKEDVEFRYFQQIDLDLDKDHKLTQEQIGYRKMSGDDSQYELVFFNGETAAVKTPDNEINPELHTHIMQQVKRRIQCKNGSEELRVVQRAFVRCLNTPMGGSTELQRTSAFFNVSEKLVGLIRGKVARYVSPSEKDADSLLKNACDFTTWRTPDSSGPKSMAGVSLLAMNTQRNAAADPRVAEAAEQKGDEDIQLTTLGLGK